MNEHEQRVDEAAAAVDLIEEQIAKALAKKDAATARGERDEYDRALRDIAYLGDRKKLAETTYQRVRAEADAAERAAKLAQLEEERRAADSDAARAEIRDLLSDAAARILEFRGIRTRALEIAELARELGIISITASVDETEIERAFARMLKEDEP